MGKPSQMVGKCINASSKFLRYVFLYVQSIFFGISCIIVCRHHVKLCTQFDEMGNV